MDCFPNLEQYSDDELLVLIAYAEAILNAQKQSDVSLLQSRRWQVLVA